jgi:hypothetical protein
VNQSPSATRTRASSRVVHALNQEWQDLVERRPPEVADWEVCGDLEGLLRRASTGDDEVLRALLTAFRAGSTLAGRTVLQAMLGRLVRLAGRDRVATVDEYVGALWCVLAQYPLTRRPVRIAANLGLDTLKAVHRDRRWGSSAGPPVGLPGAAWERLLEQTSRRVALDHAAEQGAVTASSLIDAGRRLELVDAATGRLLEHVYVDGLSGREAAARGGTTPGSLRVRCSRAVRRLAEHAPALLEAAA